MLMNWTFLRAAAIGATLTLCGAAQAQQASLAPPADAATQHLARDIFQHVIAMDTSVEGHQVPQMANYLAGLFRQAGFPERDIHIVPVGDTASLIVRYRGDGSGGRPIILMAHMDVVTAHRSDWQRDPFTLVEEGGYFFGRGATDAAPATSRMEFRS
jgi:acetylornithine deacetylase/succinyl-diaminopimelate desuccinylase-like protein